MIKYSRLLEIINHLKVSIKIMENLVNHQEDCGLRLTDTRDNLNKLIEARKELTQASWEIIDRFQEMEKLENTIVDAHKNGLNNISFNPVSLDPNYVPVIHSIPVPISRSMVEEIVNPIKINVT